MAELVNRAERVLFSLLPIALRMTPDEVEITLASCLMMAGACRARVRLLIVRLATMANGMAPQGCDTVGISLAA